MIAGLGASVLFGLAKWGIGTLSTKIAAAHEVEKNATTERERIWAKERRKSLEAKRDVLVAEGGSRINAIMRLAFALPPAVYLGKLYVWDKVLGWGATDSLSPMLEGVMWTVVGFYFLQWTTATVVGRRTK